MAGEEKRPRRFVTSQRGQLPKEVALEHLIFKVEPLTKEKGLTLKKSVLIEQQYGCRNMLDP